MCMSLCQNKKNYAAVLVCTQPPTASSPVLQSCYFLLCKKLVSLYRTAWIMCVSLCQNKKNYAAVLVCTQPPTTSAPVLQSCHFLYLKSIIYCILTVIGFFKQQISSISCYRVVQWPQYILLVCVRIRTTIMHPYSDTGCEIVWLCVKPCQMSRVQTRTAIFLDGGQIDPGTKWLGDKVIGDKVKGTKCSFASTLLFRRATVNWPSSSRNVKFAKGQTDRISLPYRARGISQLFSYSNSQAPCRIIISTTDLFLLPYTQ
jgi:hypothetical protein